MPTFHFEIVHGYTVEDPKGMELSSEQQAKAVAEQIARQIAADVESGSIKDVLVKTAQGEIIHKIPVDRSKVQEP